MPFLLGFTQHHERREEVRIFMYKFMDACPARTQANGQFYTCPVHNAHASTAEHTPILKIQNQQCYCTKGRFTILVKLPL